MGNMFSKGRQPQYNALGERLLDDQHQLSIVEDREQVTAQGSQLRSQHELSHHDPAFGLRMSQFESSRKLPETLEEAVEIFNEIWMMSQLLASPHHDQVAEIPLPIYDREFVSANMVEFYESVDLMNTFSLMSLCDLHVSAIPDPVCLVEMTFNAYRGFPNAPVVPAAADLHYRQGPIEYPQEVIPAPARIPRRPARPTLNQLGIQVNQLDERVVNARRAAIERHVRRRLDEMLDNNRGVPVANRRDESQIDQMLEEDPALEIDLINCERGKRMLILPLKPQRRGNPIDCIICQGEVSKTEADVAVLECLHWFHYECFEAWGKTNPVCPCCKRDAVLVHVTTDPSLLTPQPVGSRQGSRAGTPVRQMATPPGERMNEGICLEAPLSNQPRDQVIVVTGQNQVGNIFDPSIVPEGGRFAIVATNSVAHAEVPCCSDKIPRNPDEVMDLMMEEKIRTESNDSLSGNAQEPKNDELQGATNIMPILNQTQQMAPDAMQIEPPADNPTTLTAGQKEEPNLPAQDPPNPTAEIPEQPQGNQQARPTTAPEPEHPQEPTPSPAQTPATPDEPLQVGPPPLENPHSPQQQHDAEQHMQPAPDNQHDPHEPVRRDRSEPADPDHEHREGDHHHEQQQHQEHREQQRQQEQQRHEPVREQDDQQQQQQQQQGHTDDMRAVPIPNARDVGDHVSAEGVRDAGEPGVGVSARGHGQAGQGVPLHAENGPALEEWMDEEVLEPADRQVSS